MATSEFGKAFAAARKSGDKTFEFKGKKYTTKTADDVSKEKKGAMEKAQRGRSDMIVALTKAEREAPKETTPLARQKIAEAKRSAVESYATAQKDEDMKAYKPRPTSGELKQTTNTPVAKPAVAKAKPAAPAGRGVVRKSEMEYRKGGSINGIAKRGLTKCKTV